MSRRGLSFESLERKNLLATVTLAAGSTDGLADAIDAAGQGGTVIVESGLHEESAAVTVDIPVNIIGEPGAIVRVKTELAGGFGEAALLIQGADHTLVEGISLEGASDEGNVAIRIVDSHHVTVRNNVITDHLFGVAVESGDFAEISGNEMIGLPDTEFFKIGIVNSNGTHTRIIGTRSAGLTRESSPLASRATCSSIQSMTTIPASCCAKPLSPSRRPRVGTSPTTMRMTTCSGATSLPILQRTIFS